MNINTVKYILQNPFRLFGTLGSKGCLKWMPDKMYLKILGRYSLGYSLNLDNPRTFNEKLNWLKLHDRKPEYTRMVDKYAVREYIKEKLGEEYLIPLVGGPWNRPEEIDFDALPEQFVLKPTHDSGMLVFCRDKSKLDIPAAKAKLAKSLKREFYYGGREWPYKNVPPRIIAEKYMEDSSSPNLPVYKIFCFSGEPRIIQTIQNDKTPQESIDYFDTDWKLLDLRQSFPNSAVPMARPEKLEEMLSLARKLTAGVAFLRADFYSINGRVYFSELTFYTDGGMGPFYPPEWDKTLGTWIELPENKTV